MELKDILTITGKSGLFKHIKPTKSGFIVESIIDKKRFQVYANEHISSLNDISIYTHNGEKPVKEVFIEIFKKLNGNEAPDFKKDQDKVKQFFIDIEPDYDQDRVYASHIQKLISWYNILLNNKVVDFTEDSGKNDQKENDAVEGTEEN